MVDLTLTKVRQNTQAWANLLGVSGGAVELSKCSCHVMEWIYSRQGAPVLSPLHRKDVQIQVSDPTINCSSTLQVLSRFRAHKTLEHFQEPTGVQTEQYRRLRKMSSMLSCGSVPWCGKRHGHSTSLLATNQVSDTHFQLPCSRALNWKRFRVKRCPSSSHDADIFEIPKNKFSLVLCPSVALISVICILSKASVKSQLFSSTRGLNP